MAGGKISFRKIRGRIVPIAITRGAKIAASGGVASVGLTAALSKGSKEPITPHRGLQALGFAASVADGLLSAATFTSRGVKSFLVGQGASLGLSAASTAANIGSYAGKGSFRGRAKAAAKQEVINAAVGNAVFVGGLLAIPKSRQAIFTGATKAINFFRKAVL